MKKKTIITGLLSLSLATAMISPTYANVGSDCKGGKPKCERVINSELSIEQKYTFLKEQGIFKGKTYGKAHLNKKVTRAELAVVIDRMLDLRPSKETTFIDLKKHWAKNEITAVVEAGFMEGKGNNTFQPNKHVTLEELAQVLVRLTDLNKDKYMSIWLPGSDWAQVYLAAALTENLLRGADDYTKQAKRSHLVYGIYQAYQMLLTNKGGIVAGSLEPSINYTKNKDGSYNFTYKVKNQTEKPQTLKYSSGQRFDYKLYKNGKQIYQYSMDKLFIMEYKEIELKQGEELTFTEKVEDLKPGNYEIEFWLVAADKAETTKKKVQFSVK
ncbi:S-layer homology domain-containing protein [Bacillus luteolus]|uniref:S-layer homology domain-containing protein n=1 Tax=Litchfieldia luteola TaxID=682179 RepID=A0ABR9QFL0_9BACI|nr:BsuPI-related putative proteinase inhibitor [Cytobacillus luteolus]MBE4907280.1 S-layer homology domain-containing protein [Cytobacillus luteolus]MBP1943239.1 hypothetical protein [Cytobacillus luteolus]